MSQIVLLIIFFFKCMFSQDVQKGNNLNNETTDDIYNCFFSKQSVAYRSSLEIANLAFVRGGIQRLATLQTFPIEHTLIQC